MALDCECSVCSRSPESWGCAEVLAETESRGNSMGLKTQQGLLAARWRRRGFCSALKDSGFEPVGNPETLRLRAKLYAARRLFTLQHRRCSAVKHVGIFEHKCTKKWYEPRTNNGFEISWQKKARWMKTLMKNENNVQELWKLRGSCSFWIILKCLIWLTKNIILLKLHES